MKKQVRRSVFETNSSSIHSITMCLEDEYKKWESGELLFDKYRENFITKQEVINNLKEVERLENINWDDEEIVNEVLSDNGYITEQQFFDGYGYETFYETYTTSGGENVCAFGYYGWDG